MKVSTLCAVALLTLVPGAAHARHSQASPAGVTQFCGDRYCGSGVQEPRHSPEAHHGKTHRRSAERRLSRSKPVRAAASSERAPAHAARVAVEDRVVEHPPGCPARSFCGCGVSLRIFGKSIRELWLAANWFRFPPAKAGPGMVAVRRHHVMAIIEAHGDGTATVYDPNSGRHLTRIHRRSLAGYSVRDPRAGGV